MIDAKTQGSMGGMDGKVAIVTGGRYYLVDGGYTAV